MSSSSPPTSHTPLLPSHHLLPPPASSSTSLLPREYRKGNWTLHETLVLITAKRLDDERRALSPKPNLTNNPSSSGNTASPPPQCGGGRSAELRWKWVENYCWRNGCLRSQNQCNDKWDNLLRDYKKVRHYEMKLVTLLPKDCKNEGAGVSGGSDLPPNNNNDGSYWKMEKHERKERNLPANLVAEVFHALTDVLNRRNSCKGGQHHNAIGGSNSNINPLQLTISPRRPSLSIMPVVAAASMAFTPAVPPSQSTSTLAAVGHPPLSTIRAPTPVPPMKTHPPEPSVLGIPETESSETEKSTESDKKKRRKKLGHLGSSLIKGASMLATALLACEEKREKRHREVMELEERRLKMDSERTDSARQDMIGLITAVHTLSGTLHGFISDNTNLRRRSDIDGDDHDHDHDDDN